MHFKSQLLRFGVLVAIVLTAIGRMPLASAETPTGHLDAATREALSRSVRQLLVDCLPKTIDDSHDWGQQVEAVSGLKLSTTDGRLRLDPRKKMVNHGLWRQVQIEPVDPEQRLEFEIVSARSVGPNRVAFELMALAPLAGTTRVERWRMGVKMLNFKAESTATIGVRLKGEVGYRVDWSDQEARLHLRPKVETVDLTLPEFDLRRVGVIDGKLAEELGDRATLFLARQLDKQEPRVLEKINQALVERQDRLSLGVAWSWSAQDWGGWLGSLSGKLTGGAE